MEPNQITRGKIRAYCCHMRRLGHVLAAVLALAACSGSDIADESVETPAPTATSEPAPTTDATTTTTIIVETTTTAPEATTTILEVEVPASEPPDPAEVDLESAFAEVFADYEVAWEARREAIFDPENQELRDSLPKFYTGEYLGILIGFLDGFMASDERTRPSPESPNTVSFLNGDGLTEDGNAAAIVVCETLTEIVFELSSGIVTEDEPTSYRSLALLVVEDGVWKIMEETVSVEYPGQNGCDAT
jgi:hypothetical protein